MENKDNQSKRIYDKQTHMWFKVSPESYKEFNRWRTNLRKREQYHQRCMCPRNKWWLCDGMCQDCEFHTSGDTLSLDMPVANEDADNITLGDTIPDDTPDIDSKVCDKAEFDRCFARLNQLMPEAVEIGMLRLSGYNDGAIAEIIGVKRTTFRSRLQKVKEQLTDEYPALF